MVLTSDSQSLLGMGLAVVIISTDVAVAQGVLELHDAANDFGSRASVADIGVDRVGKIDGVASRGRMIIIAPSA